MALHPHQHVLFKHKGYPILCKAVKNHRNDNGGRINPIFFCVEELWDEHQVIEVKQGDVDSGEKQKDNQQIFSLYLGIIDGQNHKKAHKNYPNSYMPKYLPASFH